jgi:DNA topoisomerase-1
MPREQKITTAVEPPISARQAGLRYVRDTMPGIRRIYSGKNFRYLDAGNKIVRDPATLARIKSLAIPPAWTDVWICPIENGHLQATGRDARGRKQHRYHKNWREHRDETKYSRMIEFAHVLPRIRRRVAHDLRLRGLPREKVLASIVKLLEISHIRIGNDEYAQNNNSFGLTTLRNRHAKVAGDRLHFQFRGKSGKIHTVDVEHRRVARIVQRCQSIPGQELFEYVDENGQPRDVNSGDVNDYLREITGADFTAKDFRTWAGTILAACALREIGEFNTVRQARSNVVRAIAVVANRLGNTPAVCKKSYIHPAVIDAYLSRALFESAHASNGKKSKHALLPEESSVAALLRRKLLEEKRSLKSKLTASLKQLRSREKYVHG